MPPVEQRRESSRNKARVKRAKTYSGCWTCRSRKVKCGEEKPTCRRCNLASLVCQGYHVELVWSPADGEDGRNLVTRRTMLDGHESFRPILSYRSLQSALTNIDASKGETDLQVGPFSVFSLSQPTRARAIVCEGPVQRTGNGSAKDIDENEVLSSPDPSWIDTSSQSSINEGDENSLLGNATVGNAPDENTPHENTPHDDSIDDVVTDGMSGTTAMARLKQRITPHLVPYLSSSSPEERQLLHYWITNLSGMMIPTPRQDNPFQTIFIPLALSAADAGDPASGNAALLHAIYALSAFNRAQVSATKDHFLSVGTKHHLKSLEYLRRNLVRTDESQKEALLAAIIAMSSIEVIRGTSSSWRVHLTGGRTWLEAIHAQDWADNHNANTLRQIFLCVEALNPGNRRRVGDVTSSDDTFSESGAIETMTGPGSIRSGYILDKIFGITEPIFHALLRINQLSRRVCPALTEELDELERHIRLSDPDALVANAHDEYDQLTQNHACAFYNACLIHFHRTLKRTAPARLQRLVQRSLYHLGEIAKLETDMNVCGLLWPLFITACEVEGSSNLRQACIRLFEKGKLFGIGNMCSAAAIVLEVWRHRDDDTLGADVHWQDVMDDLGVDILLT
ncbi:uncharacterized protein BDZ99DRAFT_278122 [Mytilinidion resinicola]|uniref:Zn(2)-C6 fungal-type domain-containing protein n=1 Tax=Mytilinidion resinicola TaxID=574789 RepID=A0A6A6YUH9_9PEZI|nr:uncharacterized protein BDZ99DRAFT_278122 [Mytilinidion resinicola]KAF2811625.1 hypothetical protein BDZ99DRAFT_278122 [Mytilinidion resinicola]